MMKLKLFGGFSALISAFLMCNWAVSGAEYSHTIYIDPNATENHPDCLTSGSQSTPCRNITWVFQQAHSDSTHYVLSGGEHYLTNTTPPFKDLTSLAITGDDSVVTCSEAGLAFINVANLMLNGVTFFQCAALRNSTSKNFTTNTISEFKVALYFYLCENVNMSHVTVERSPDATGVVMYDTNGTNTISNSTFSDNRVMDGNAYQGGGGFYVEFTYCQPGVLSCDELTGERNNGAVYTFTDCEFRDNRADNNDQSTFIFPHKEDHQSFGRGGGMSLYIRGSAADIVFTLESCKFTNNVAVWGGGLFIEVHDGVFGSKITVNDTEFNGNACPYTRYNGTAGGGVHVAHYVYDSIPKTATRNEFEFSNCTFENNTALNGAGISVAWALQNALAEQTVHIHIRNSLFRKNTAKLGSGLRVYQFWEISQGLIALVYVESCTFDGNSNRYWEVVEGGEVLKPVQLGFGSVFVASSRVWFRNSVLFNNTKGSALAVSGGSVSFDGTYAVFENSYAHQGGGIFIVGASTIELGFGTEMVFRNNSAIYRGGAINVVYISRQTLETDEECFFRHTDPSKDPEEWNVTMTFVDNWESQHTSCNAIYSTTILPCSLIGGSGRAPDTSKLLCWDGWSYDNGTGPVECESQIATDVGSMEYEGTCGMNGVGTGNHFQAVPGWEFDLPLKMTDDLNRVIGQQAVFAADVSDDESSHFMYQFLIYNKTASVYGLEGRTYKLKLITVSTRAWYGELYIDLQKCPPGFTISNSNSCVCSGNYGGDVYCNSKSHEAGISQDYWMNMFNGSYYIAACPRGYCNNNRSRYLSLPHDREQLNHVLCAQERNGTMCGECVSGYGPAINSLTYECVNCTDVNLASNVAKYVASVYIPLAALFTVLILFDIRLTTGPANAFILYGQVISSTFSLDADGGVPLDQITHHSKLLIETYRFPYGIFNLEFIENFLPPICLSTRFNTLSVLSLEYCVALSPLIMIAVILSLVKLKSYCRFSRRKGISVVYDTLGRNTKTIGEAMLPAFASFILLSYTKFSTVSAYIFATNTLIDENGNRYSDGDGVFVYLAGQLVPHSKEYYQYYVPALIICCTFVAIPPLILLDYPLHIIEWLISKFRRLERMYPATKVHIMLDTFQGCYRDNMRFFPGLYFLFRLFVNVISYRFFHTWSQQFILQQISCCVMITLVALCQPYKRRFLNYVDILMFANLAIVNSLSHYLYESLKNHQIFDPSRLVLSVQYILVFLPLIYMLAFVAWVKTKKYHEQIELFLYKLLLRCCPLPPRYQQLKTAIRNSITRTPLDVAGPDRQPDDIDAFFDRSMAPNTYRRSKVPVTVVGMRKNRGSGEAISVSHCDSMESTPLDSGRRSTDSHGAAYGSTNTTADSCVPTQGSTHRNSNDSSGKTGRSDSGCQTTQ